MASSLILSFLSLNALCSLGFGIFLNAILFCLVKFNANGDLREYRWAHYYFCSVHTLLLCLHAIIQPVHIMTKDSPSFIAFNGAAAEITNNFVEYSLVIAYFTCYNSIIVSLALQFFDRYLLICRKIHSRFWRYAILGMLNCCILSLMISCLLIYHSSTETQSGENYPELLDILSEDDAKRIRMASEFDQGNPLKATAASMLIFSMLFCFFMVIFCYLRICSFLSTNLPTTGFHSNVKLLKDISRSLLVQTFLPLFCQTVAICSLMLRLTQPYSPLLLSLEMFTTVPNCWLPVLNPLITMITIKEYRNAIRKIFRKIGKSSTVQIQSYQSPGTLPMAAAAAMPQWTPIITINHQNHLQLEPMNNVNVNLHRKSVPF